MPPRFVLAWLPLRLRPRRKVASYQVARARSAMPSGKAIAAMRDQGMTVAEMMEATGLSQSSIYRALRKLGKV
jgi:DNA-binding transcriptional ArsR family regulator